MASLVGQAKKAHARRGSLSVVKPREERLDKTQGLHESDYHLQGKDVPMDVVAPSAVPLDVFDYTQLEEVRPWPKPSPLTYVATTMLPFMTCPLVYVVQIAANLLITME